MASPRVTVEAWTLTRTSSCFGTGRATSSTRSTSGGPYRSWTTALMDGRKGRRASARRPHEVLWRGHLTVLDQIHAGPAGAVIVVASGWERRPAGRWRRRVV